MDGGNEQRVAIKFCFKASPSVTETLVLVQKDYTNEAVNWSNVFRWHSWFWEGRELGEDDERGGHPKSTQTEVNIAAAVELVKNDHQIAPRMIAESLNILKTVVLLILKENLGKRKMCACFVPHTLTPEQREDQVTSCQDITAMTDADKHFFKQKYYGRWDLVFCLWPRNKATEFWMGWWDIPSAEGTKIPKVQHQEHVDNFFRLSRHSSQRIRIRGKNSRCRTLYRSNGSPPEAHSAGSSSCVLLSRFFLVAR